MARPRAAVRQLRHGGGLARRAGLPRDMVFGAELFRACKPDPETCLGARGLLGLAPGEAMMCAAHHQDLRAAAALGVRPAFIARPTEYGPGQTQDLVAEAAWDVVTDSITALATLLGA